MVDSLIARSFLAAALNGAGKFNLGL